MIPILVGSDFGWLTAMGAVLVMVVMVAAGIIRVDIIQHYSINNSHQWLVRTLGLSFELSCYVALRKFNSESRPSDCGKVTE